MTFISVDPMKRFLDKIQVDGECHLWQSTIKRDGYGQFWYEGKSTKAHHAAYRMFKGEIPTGLCVLHKCDVRICVNPEHLFLGTIQDNVKDMDAKGRRRGRNKLSPEQVAKVRRLLEHGFSQQMIADLFMVHQTLISRIKLGKRRFYH